MDVKILYTEGCAATPKTIQLVQDVAHEMGVPILLQRTAVVSAEEAAALRFLGSPTVQIDGLDVDPAARASTAFGFM